jgi:hypothetical protein
VVFQHANEIDLDTIIAFCKPRHILHLDNTDDSSSWRSKR